ncbi:MAG: phospholipase D family protein [Thermomicrobiales bacterium]
MSKRKTKASSGAMLDLWRPPQGAGDPIGCLATTYTFAPELFDEQCLARFLEIESEPSREDLAFLLERENQLGSVYAGVLADYTQAGVEHSLRWDVLPVRIWNSKQHAKLSLLAWTDHVRIIVASANLTEPGYRSNHEVAATVDLSPENANADLLVQAADFLRSLLLLVPGADERPPEVLRARMFLDQVERRVRRWKPTRRATAIRQQLVFTLPVVGGQAARSSLEEAIHACRGRGGSPEKVQVASPFFDADEETSRVTVALCKLMARGRRRQFRFCVPAIRDHVVTTVPRLAAPKSLLLTPSAYQGDVTVEILPDLDRDKNRRSWHAKMLAFRADRYSGLMVGSSNFTCAGMGVGQPRNSEANLLTIADRVTYGRDVGLLEALWPDMEPVADPESAEWVGARADQDEEESTSPLPAGFVSATYRAGDNRQIVLRFAPDLLPEDWQVYACGQTERELLSATTWQERDRPTIIELAWVSVQPPTMLRVQWADNEAFLSLNVEDSRNLPPLAQLADMSADDMLLILAATDPSAAFRAWAKGKQPPDLFDTNLDSATPIDLDPLRRYDLHATFLHRIRRRARILAQLRSNLQRSVWGRQALEWRLQGLVGIGPLADRLVRDFLNSTDNADETLLSLADFLIVLREVEYQPSDGSLPKAEFEKTFRRFLSELANKLQQQVDAHCDQVSLELLHFWQRVLDKCQA